MSNPHDQLGRCTAAPGHGPWPADSAVRRHPVLAGADCG